MTDPSPATAPGRLFDAAAVADATVTVPELSARIARLAAQAFPADLWVSGQIRNLKRSGNGHVYFDLAEPTEGGATPGSLIAVTLLAPERALVNNQITRAGGGVRMEDGIEVRIKARLRWYEPRGTLQLRMSAIDPEFTLGRLRADRDRVLATLKADRLLDANGRRTMPPVPLRLALITSRNSAAHADVMAELEGSSLAFSVTLFDVRTQGPAAAGQIAGALTRIAQRAPHDGPPEFDAVLLVRGGGASTDLAAFDAEPVARAIAAMPVPVITGIGHEIDRSVADEVAHTACKTPTAAAGTLVTEVRRFVARLDSTWGSTRRAASAAVATSDRRLDRRRQAVARAAGRSLRVGDDRLRRTALGVSAAGQRSVRRAASATGSAATAVTQRSDRAVRLSARHLDGLAARVRAHDPVHAMARGWTITAGPDGRSIRSIADLEPGATLTTHFADGTATSTVTGAAARRTDVPGAPHV